MTRARFPAIQGSWTQGVLSSGVCQTRASGTRRSQPVMNALKATSNSAARVLLVARGSAGLGFTEVHAGRAQMRSVRHAPGSPEMPSLQQRGSHQIRTTAPGRAMLGTGSLVNLVCHVALQVALLVSTEGLVQWTLMHLALRATLVTFPRTVNSLTARTQHNVIGLATLVSTSRRRDCVCLVLHRKFWSKHHLRPESRSGISTVHFCYLWSCRNNQTMKW